MGWGVVGGSPTISVTPLGALRHDLRYRNCDGASIGDVGPKINSESV